MTLGLGWWAEGVVPFTYSMFYVDCGQCGQPWSGRPLRRDGSAQLNMAQSWIAKVSWYIRVDVWWMCGWILGLRRMAPVCFSFAQWGMGHGEKQSSPSSDEGVRQQGKRGRLTDRGL